MQIRHVLFLLPSLLGRTSSASIPPPSPTESYDWTPAGAPVQSSTRNPVLVPTDFAEWILGDPSLLDLPNGDRYVFANEIFHSIIWYKASPTGGSEFSYVRQPGSVVAAPGAVRPFARYDPETEKVHLFYEQYQITSLYKKSAIWMKTGDVTFTDGGSSIEWRRGDVKILTPTLDWEKIGTQRVGNPFVYYNPAQKSYVLYYSASSIHLPDSGVDEPIYLGMATAPSISGPYTRASDQPLVVAGIDGTSVGLGSLKFVKGVEQDYGRPVAIINRITEKGGVTGSTISLVSSQDGGLTFGFVRDLIEPTLVEGDWNEAYCYGFDTGVDAEDGDYILVLYNGRDGWKHATETVGASRVKREVFVV